MHLPSNCSLSTTPLSHSFNQPTTTTTTTTTKKNKNDRKNQRNAFQIRYFFLFFRVNQPKQKKTKQKKEPTALKAQEPPYLPSATGVGGGWGAGGQG